MSERNPGGDRGRWSPPPWPEEPAEPGDQENDSPEASVFGPVTNDRYPKPQWPGETNGPGSSVFGAPTAPTAPSLPPAPPTPRYPDRQAYLPPPASPPTVPNYPPAEPYPEPTRPQPRLPAGGPPGRPPRERYNRQHDDRDRGPGGEPRGRGDRDAPGGGGRRTGHGFPLGAGFLFGATGLACFLLALLVLPWFEAAGQEVTLADLREAFTVPATNPDSLPGANADQTTTTVAGAPALPSPDQVQDAVEAQVRSAAAEAAASAIDSGKARYLEIYTETLWLVLAIAVSLSVLFSTILSPRSAALSMLLGFRRLSGVVVILAGIVHGAALWVVFTGAGAPDPAFGVWLGAGGLAAVFLGCILGPKRS